ncbi:MAG: hypothetical protein GKS07_07970 [Nitrosopumilus sp.]|nr:MAG: hypothetical protein GKS07_00090 [Nitrosopumilus sp.]QMU54815.1 MAG: hypothetical protein GKS07_07970 [Nitrosopumilus sp.]
MIIKARQHAGMINGCTGMIENCTGMIDDNTVLITKTNETKYTVSGRKKRSS